jgi:hypothetical protein
MCATCPAQLTTACSGILKARKRLRKPKRHVTVWINPLKPSGHYMYRQFNIQQLYVLPTQCIYVFCVDLRTNSDYFTVQH